MEPKKKAELSRVEYLEEKYSTLEQQIADKEAHHQLESDEIRELYYKKGKIFSEIELMKRVKDYD